MIKVLREQPKHWLTLEICESLFNTFCKDLSFNEPIPLFQTRFSGKLEGTLYSVSQTFEGKHLKPTILDAASAYFFYFIKGHPFQNGNKRMGTLFTHYFLLSHGLTFSLSNEELFALAVGVALNEKDSITENEVKDIISSNIKKL